MGETFAENTTNNTSLPYCYEAQNTVDGNWAAITAAPGVSVNATPEVSLRATTSSNVYTYKSDVMCGFDLAAGIPRAGFRATYGWVRMKLVTGLSVSNFWPTDSQRGIGLVLTDETIKSGSTAHSTEDYEAINQGPLTEIATRVPQSSLTAGWVYWIFNAAGLEYLNTVKYKSAFTGTFWAGLVFGGQIDSVTPTWLSESVDEYVFYGAGSVGNEPSIYLEYSPLCQINIGDVWKDVWEAQINIGDVWKDVRDIQINVGDVWKNL